MRLSFVTAAALFASAGTWALGAPQESFSQAGGTITGTFQSDGRAFSPLNGVATFNATGTYAPKRLIIGGTLTSGGVGSWQLESSILVTPPSGNSFVINASVTGATYTVFNLPANFAAVTGGPVASAAGTWELRFYETWDDPSVDATWSNLTVTLDDADPAFPPVPGTAFASNVWSDVDSDGTATSGTPTVLTWDYTGTSNASAVSIGGLAVGRTGFDINKDDTQTGELRVGVTPPGGTEIVRQIAAGPRTTSPVTHNGLVVNLPGPTAPGTWTVRLFEGSRNGDGVADDSGVDNTWRRFFLALLPSDPPASETLNLVDGVFVTDTETLSGTAVKWYSFTVPAIDAAGGTALDIDTETSGVGDTSIGLYAANGQRVDVDFDGGSGDLSQLSFGAGFRNSVPGANRFNGRNGATLDAGTYYLAVSGGSDVIYQPGAWGVDNPGPGEAGSVTVRVRLWSTSVPAPEAPVATDLGLLGGDKTATFTIENAEVKWFKFSIPGPAEDDFGGNGKYVDIDTADSPQIGGNWFLNENDTEIGLYDDQGNRVAFNDDSAAAQSLLSALSFGQATPTRPYPNVVEGNGRSGSLTGASYPATFYVAAGMWETVYNTTNFDAWGDFGVTRPNYVLKIRSNFPAGPTGCSPADVATEGSPQPFIDGPDGFITGTDFDVFVQAFFQEIRRPAPSGPYIADLTDDTGTGGPDTFITGADFDFFITKFFIGCP